MILHRMIWNIPQVKIIIIIVFVVINVAFCVVP